MFKILKNFLFIIDQYYINFEVIPNVLWLFILLLLEISISNYLLDYKKHNDYIILHYEKLTINVIYHYLREKILVKM